MMVYILAVVVLILLLIVQHYTWRADAWPREGVKPPPYQGHRGYWKGGEQENTLGSFSAAGLRGLQMIELDVRLSKDKVPVVFHDDNFQRLGHENAEYKNKKIFDLTALQINEWQNIPCLEDVLTSSSVPSLVNIEIKSSAIFNSELEMAVAKIVKKVGAEKRVLFSSFNPFVIWRLSHRLPQVPRALLVTEEGTPENRYILKRQWLAPYINVNALHLDHRFTSVEDIYKYKKRNIPVALWTVNSAERAQEYLKAGALSIITDVLDSTGKQDAAATDLS